MSLLSLGPPVNWLQERMDDRFAYVATKVKRWRMDIFEPRVREALRATNGFSASVSVRPDSLALQRIIERRLISLCKYGEQEL